MSVTIIVKPVASGKIHLSTFESLYKPNVGIQRHCTFAEAVKLFTTFALTDNKNSASMYSGAVYGETFYRCDVNVIAKSVIVIDYDNEVKDVKGDGLKQCSENPTHPKDLEDFLVGLTYFYHSTHSNTASWPKWRLIIPLDRHVNLVEWPQVVNGILNLLGGYDPNIDKSCFQLSRAFFVPSYPKKHAKAAFAGYSNGSEVISCSLL